MDTDEAMDDADTHLYTTTIHDHSSLIGGTPAS